MRKVCLLLACSFIIILFSSCITIGTLDENAKHNAYLQYISDLMTNTSTKPYSKSYWEKTYYVDDFGTPTSVPYVTNIGFFEGTFSNSVTNNSNMYARILVNKNNIEIKLFEYDMKLPVKSWNEHRRASVKIQLQDGTIVDSGELCYFSSYSRDRLIISETTPTLAKELFKVLATNSQFKLRISYSGSVYMFTVYSDGLVDEYREAFL